MHCEAGHPIEGESHWASCASDGCMARDETKRARTAHGHVVDLVRILSDSSTLGHLPTCVTALYSICPCQRDSLLASTYSAILRSIAQIPCAIVFAALSVSNKPFLPWMTDGPHFGISRFHGNGKRYKPNCFTVPYLFLCSHIPFYTTSAKWTWYTMVYPICSGR